MARSLVLAEVVDNVVSPLTAEAVAAAASLGGEVSLAVIGADAETLAGQLTYVGVDEIITVVAAGSDRDHEQMVQAAEALIADVAPDVVLAAFTIRSATWAAALAEKVDLAFLPDVVALASTADGLTAARSIYEGRVRADYAFPTDQPVLALVRGSAWAPAEPGGSAPTRSLDVSFEASRVRAGELRRPSGDLDLSSADVIFAVGRGVGSQDNVALFADVAQRLGATLAASRPVVDAGWLPAEHQVGQTGKTVKPQVYLAFGISGAQQHLAGMQDSKVIVAVNSNKDAPIFDFADVGAVADIHEVAEQLRVILA